ncbi:hypothetical protein Tco_1151190 [Tanacetum coccineum]
MAFESSSQPLPKTLTYPSNVHFELEDGNIAFNNSVALLEYKYPEYKDMLRFISNSCIEYVSLLDHEAMKDAIATLGLSDEKEPEMSSKDVAHSSPLRLRFFSLTWKVLMTYLVKCLGGNQGSHDQLNVNQQLIAYALCWGLNIDIAGKDYVNKDLFAIKSYQITGATFKQSSISEVPLTSYMRKIAKLDEEPLITPFEEANIEASSDMSLSGTSIHPVQENIVTEDEHIADEQHDDTEFVDSGILSMGDVSLESLNKATNESPYDTESEIKFVKRFKPVPNDEEPLFKSVSNKESDTKEDSELASILDDEVRSPSAFQTSESEEDSQSEPLLSKSKERDADYILDEINDLQASADKPTDTTSHLQAEITSLSTKVNQMESNITKKVSEEIQTSVPTLITKALKQQLPGMLKCFEANLSTLVKNHTKSLYTSV